MIFQHKLLGIYLNFIPKDMEKIRRQLTLFVDPKYAEAIESARKAFNPVQFGLIKSHVTLCREDEIAVLEPVIHHISTLELGGITIDFGPPVRFGNENSGVLLPAIGDISAFQALRSAILRGIVDQPRPSEPHITLMHPRNSTCSDSIFENIARRVFPTTIPFASISLIEQIDDGSWKVLRVFDLSKKH